MLKDIEHLARAGFAIHWLKPKSKSPIGKEWASKPVKTLEQLKATYKDGNNVGVRLGKWSKIGSDFLHTIDMDIRKPELVDVARAALKDLFPDYRKFPSVISGSGGESRHFHILSDKPFPSKKLIHSEDFSLVWDAKLEKDVKKWDWEIELFGTGKQVALPPSIHPDTGKAYRWEREFDFDDVALGLGPFVSSDRLAELLDMDDADNGEIDPEKLEPLGLSVDDVRDMLAKLPNDDRDYDEWLNVMASVQHECAGRPKAERKAFYEVFRDWSRQSDKHDDETAEYKFFTFKNSAGRRHRTMRSIQSEIRDIELEEAMDDLGDEFDDLGEEIEDQFSDFDDILGGKSEEITPRQVRLNKAEVEAELGHVPKRIARLNRKHAVAFVQGKTVIITENADGTTAYGTPNELHNWYENDRVATEKSTQPVSKAWMQHKMRREYPNGIVFAPGQVREGAFNHWKGFDVEPSSEGSCKLFLSHLREVICSGNEEHYRYALGWFAHMVQKPWEKPGVAMVLRGKKRIGKDTIADYFGGLIKRYHVTVANQDQMVGKFNAHQEKCLLLHVQEGFWAGNKQAEGSLKYLITSTSVLIEPKSVNAFTVDSFLRLFISSNEDWVVPATADEGRYFVLDVATHRKDDHKYFAAMKHEMNNGGLSALLYYLMNYDLSDFEVRKIPDTAALADQKTKGLKNLDKWWFSMLESGELEFEFSNIKGASADWQTGSIIVDRDEFRLAYSNWMRHQRFDGGEMAKFVIGKRLRELCPSIEDRRRREGSRQIWVYCIPRLSVCRSEFDTFMNSKIKWESTDAPEIEIEDDFDDL